MLRRINPSKMSTHSESGRNKRGSVLSPLKPTITSTIWDLLQETKPSMFQFSNLAGPNHTFASECAQMCSRVLQANSKPGPSASRKRYNAKEVILIDNVAPKCWMTFDHIHSSRGSNQPLLQQTLTGNNPILSVQPQQVNVNSNQDKKTCIESSRHIITHNGLVIQHPTLRIVPTNQQVYINSSMVTEGQTLPALEFVLKLESSNSSSNGQYYNLVLKVRNFS